MTVTLPERLRLAAPISAPPAPGPEPEPGAGPADDIAYLHGCGLSRTAIGCTAGVDTSTLACVVSGDRPASRRTAAALRAARLAWTPPAGHLLAVPGVRRLQALAYIGHPPTQLAARLAQPAALVWEWTTGEHRFLPRAVIPEVDVLYRRLWLTEGNSAEVAGYARRRRWASALAWDDRTIDDLCARPEPGRRGPDGIVDPIAVELALAGDAVAAARLTIGERHAAAALGGQRGMSAAVLAERLGCSDRTVQRARVATGPIDLFADYYGSGEAA